MMARLLALIFALICGSAFAGPGFWSSSGPWGGEIGKVLIHPTLPSTMYVSSRGGIFRSFDGGVSWNRAESGITGSVGYSYPLAMDLDAPAQLYSIDISGRLYRTLDGGDNWTLTGYSVPAGDLAVELTDVPGPTGQILLLLTAGQVLKSVDSGSTFTPSSTGLPAGIEFARVVADAATPNLLLTCTAQFQTLATPTTPAPPTLFRSTTGGASWSGVYTLSGLGVTNGCSDLSFGAGARIYAAIEGQLHTSINDGANWSPTPGALPATALLAHPTVSNTVFLADAINGLRRSTDAGTSATPINTGLTPNPTYAAATGVTTVALHPNYPTTPTLFAGTQFAGLYRSINDGLSWNPQHEGIGATNIRAVAVNPNPSLNGSSNRRLFAGYGDPSFISPALFQSTNSGASWSIANNGLNAAQIRGLAIDFTTVGTTPGGAAGTVVYASGRSAISPGTLRNGGIYKSVDNGATWSTIDIGLPTSGSPVRPFISTVRTVVLDPRSCASPPPTGRCTTGPLQTVYATASGQSRITPPATMQEFTFRLLKSTNAGANWTAIDGNLPPSRLDVSGNVVEWITPVPLVMNTTNPSILYTGFFTSSFDEPPAFTLASGVYRSNDGGATWIRRAAGLPTRAGCSVCTLDVLSLAMHPTDTETLWASVIDLTNGSTASIYKTVNGGVTWTESRTGIPVGLDIRALTVDPGNPLVLYATGGGTPASPGAVYKSDDGGASWSSISIGLPADAALALTIDPFNPSIVYAGTNSGLWQMEQVPDADGDGAPDATEGNAPNNGDGNNDGNADAVQSNVGSTIALLGNRLAAPLVSGSFTASIIAPVTGECSQFNNVQQPLAARYGRDYLPGGEGLGRYYAYPQEVVSFEIQNCQAATVQIKFHAPGVDFAPYGWSYRFYGPQAPGVDSTIGWYDFSSRATRVDARTWRLTLNANQFGSYRPDGNSILFVGGPAFFDDRVFFNGFE